MFISNIFLTFVHRVHWEMGLLETFQSLLPTFSRFLYVYKYMSHFIISFLKHFICKILSKNFKNVFMC